MVGLSWDEAGPEGPTPLAPTHLVAAGLVPAQGCSACAAVPSITAWHTSCVSETSENNKPKLETEESG